MKDVFLPTAEDIYSDLSAEFANFRDIYFIKTEQEREIGIGEEYKDDEIPFG